MPECPTPGCGYRLSDQDTVCPDCGTEVRRQAADPIAAAAASAPPAQAVRIGVRPARGPESPGDRPPAARLTLKRAGELTQTIFPVGERTVIGRHDIETGPVDADLSPLRDDSVSRQHAEIWCDRNGQWRIRDLGSKNGTFIQLPGQRKPLKVEKDDSQPLHDGDEVVLGAARFEFRVEGNGV